MVFRLSLILFLCLFSVMTYAQPSNDLNGYQYVQSKQSLYKLHTTAKTWQEAKSTCREEGGFLLYPEDSLEAAEMINVMSQSKYLSVDWVFVDASAKLSQAGDSDGETVKDIYKSWVMGQLTDNDPQLCILLKRQDGSLEADACEHQHYFVCKKSPSRLLNWNIECNMPSYLGYQYDGASQRCYKFHPNPSNLNWDGASAVCTSERSYLAVIDNEQEADHMSSLTMSSPKLRTKHDPNTCVFLGFKKISGGIWQTIKGNKDAGNEFHSFAVRIKNVEAKRFERTGGFPLTYTAWGQGEPNNAGPNENCGGMSYNGKLNDVGCHLGCFFICEHEVHRFEAHETQTSSYNTVFTDDTLHYIERADSTN